MMAVWTKSLMSLFIGTVLLSQSFAAETEEEKNHIIPDSRPISLVQRMEIQEEREKQQNEAVEDNAPALSLGAQGSISFEIPKAGVFFTTHEGVFHSPIGISIFGDTVEFEDGSIWSISSGDSYKTLNWIMSDLIVVSANHDWFSSYLFRMTNQNTGVSAKCNLTLGPIYNGVYTHWIVGINYFTQEILLEDNSIWNVTGFDSSTFSKWMLNDTVIIGINDGFLSSSKPNILINVNTLTYTRAKCKW